MQLNIFVQLLLSNAQKTFKITGEQKAGFKEMGTKRTHIQNKNEIDETFETHNETWTIKHSQDIQKVGAARENRE